MNKLIAALLVAATALASWAGTPTTPTMPPFLKPGDKIAIISPASTPKRAAVDKADSVLRSWGLVPVQGPNVNAVHHLWAGTWQQRLADVMWALRDPSIKAILCSRGGYGSTGVLRHLPIDTLARYGSKWIIGYSDITAMHSAWVRSGHASIHASMTGHLGKTGGQDQYSTTLRQLLFGTLPSYRVAGHQLNKPGHARGMLIGGNLAVMSNTSGARDYDFLDADFVKDRDIIFFFEDVGENISRVSSMLQQMDLRGLLGHVKGIVVGRFTEWEPSKGYKTMNEMIAELLAPYDIPVCYDFPASHDESHNTPLIEGAMVDLTVSRDTVTLNFVK